jgi:preprotein translocase subunit SecB
MKLSPLQLLEYFVADFHFTLNGRFDPKKGLELKVEELDATPRCDRHVDNQPKWTVVLELKYQPSAETNTPYIFSIVLVGLFEVSKGVKDDLVDRLVRTNGASVLYGIARELIREQTARGPDGPLILPTASFVPESPIDTPASSTVEPDQTSSQPPVPSSAKAKRRNQRAG